MRGVSIALAFSSAITLTQASMPAWGAGLKGTVTLPDELKAGRRHPGYVRMENGIVPVDSSLPKGETVVVLTGGRGAPPAAKTVTVDLVGLGASPPMVVVGVGSVVEFKNADRVAHDLSTPAHFSLMPVERLLPGNIRRQKFSQPGGYVVRCSEYPSVSVSVIVVDTPHYDVVDDKGQFKLADVADGSATLKVWSQGRWVHEESVVVGRDNDIQLRVASPKGSKGEGKGEDKGGE